MAQSEAIKLARIQQQVELERDVVKVLCDPLWSSVLGFVLVHQARRANLVGPVADDLLYAGIIAINSTRAGITREAREGAVGLAQATSEMIGSAGKVAGMLGGLLAGA